MELLFLLFGIISLLLIVDGQALRKQERVRPLLRQFRLDKDKRKTGFIAGFMQIGGGVTLIWTIVGFFLYDLLAIPVFIIIYILLLGIIAGAGAVAWHQKFKKER